MKIKFFDVQSPAKIPQKSRAVELQYRRNACLLITLTRVSKTHFFNENKAKINYWTFHPLRLPPAAVHVYACKCTCIFAHSRHIGHTKFNFLLTISCICSHVLFISVNVRLPSNSTLLYTFTDWSLWLNIDTF